MGEICQFCSPDERIYLQMNILQTKIRMSEAFAKEADTTTWDELWNENLMSIRSICNWNLVMFAHRICLDEGMKCSFFTTDQCSGWRWFPFVFQPWYEQHQKPSIHGLFKRMIRKHDLLIISNSPRAVVVGFWLFLSLSSAWLLLFCLNQSWQTSHHFTPFFDAFQAFTATGADVWKLQELDVFWVQSCESPGCIAPCD